ncbi:branched-chain amino acid transport system II carrier protein [Halalkalibacter krulwichiae]|uniref:Branched-chain amino acid transport system carrier protein n=1 Tax=Halalkalibacter krulwichiae TaxID=199441 RepID=A0A1X9MHB4_9BACI|nr:branched-chain amino acid transport system II carrier protein [Halalkalibacter krulwichiae]ARK32859.1 Branched-chain amino acid transport system 2 carrier protein [Halalkalibacter krulwichiae]
MKRSLPIKETIALGLFMFALFLGAGNLIFPPLLGQQAGEALWSAVLGFLVTGVGLPLLAIIAISNVKGDLDVLSKRVHKSFALVFPVLIYLTIGPFFGIPRTGTVAYEVGVVPFLGEASRFSLFLATLIFFAVTFWISLNPTKLVDRVGKVLTPILLLVILVIAIRAFVSPLGSVSEITDAYRENAFFGGFLEGFLTMDAIAALIFGVVIINRIRERGFTSVSDIRSNTILAGIIAGVGLSFVYLSLAFMGATSVETIGIQENGGAILAGVTSSLFGSFGSMLLAIVITGACLTTSVGLVSACGEYLSKRFSSFSYPVVIAVLCLFSLTMANLGLSQLIAVSLPLLIVIYPITIVLILLSITESFKKVTSSVYMGAIIGAAIVSTYDGLTTAGFDIDILTNLFSYLPLYNVGVGWLVPSLVGGLLGGLLGKR